MGSIIKEKNWVIHGANKIALSFQDKRAEALEASGRTGDICLHFTHF